jgi:putative intracellular protease/amidase
MYAQIALFDGFDPLDVIAPCEVLYAGGTASGCAVSVELVAEGPREVVSGTGAWCRAPLQPSIPGVRA